MSSTPATQPTSPGMHEESRRAKLRKIAELGHDPWGQRFDGHLPIAEIRAREGEITIEPLPPDADPKQQAQRRAARPQGPRRRPHRAAAQAGQADLPHIRDWTGHIQVFIGQQAGRRRRLGVGRVLRPGRPRSASTAS